MISKIFSFHTKPCEPIVNGSPVTYFEGQKEKVPVIKFLRATSKKTENISSF